MTIFDRTSSSHAAGASSARFLATRWSVVLAAAGRGGTDGGLAASTASSRRALNELIQAYWFPLYAFVRRQGHGPQAAEDLVQGFFAHLLENAGLTTADRSKGKFRSFLLASMKHFVSDERDKARTARRGGGRRVVSLDTAAAEANYARELSDTLTPERLFERSWAIAVLNQVVLRLEREYDRRGKSEAFAAMRHCLDGQSDERSHADIAASLGMSEGAVRTMAHRLRRRYRELLRDEITQTIADAECVDEEIRYLLSCL